MMVDKRGTVTPAEHDVLEVLRTGPALCGPRTESFAQRPVPSWYRTGGKVAPVRGEGAVLRYVDRKVARTLAKAGLVAIDAGAEATLTPLGLDLVNDRGDAQ